MTNTNAWTVGNPKNYDRALAVGDGVINKCVGGWVWKDIDDALMWLNQRNWNYTWDGVPVHLHPYALLLPGTWEDCVDEKGDSEEGLATILVKAKVTHKWNPK